MVSLQIFQYAVRTSDLNTLITIGCSGDLDTLYVPVVTTDHHTGCRLQEVKLRTLCSIGIGKHVDHLALLTIDTTLYSYGLCKSVLTACQQDLLTCLYILNCGVDIQRRIQGTCT